MLLPNSFCSHRNVIFLSSIWIGVDDIDVESRFDICRWRSRWSFSPRYYFPSFRYQSDDTNFALHFAANQPDNLGNEDCVHFTPKTGTSRSDLYPFNDAPCHWNHWAAFICEACLQPPVPVVLCQDGYEPLNDYCYKLHPVKKSYDDAQATCADEGGTLIEPRSLRDLHLIETEWGPLKKL